ncbi:hypothetical protein DIPPA_00596 [Diplonema papillatum]|nr:hypothetical protein DIPPA_00596 [Diplonema papillatum]
MSISGGEGMTASEMINSTLLTIGYPETLEKDLEYASEMLSRAVVRLKKKEPKIDFSPHHTQPEEVGRQLKSALVIKAVNDLNVRKEAEKQRQT